jgi:excisionase family DNA binding protein
MVNQTLPQIWTVKEIAGYLKVDESAVLQELQSGSLHGFQIGKEWRCSDTDLLSYISKSGSNVERDQLQPPKTSEHDVNWEIAEIKPFDFHWPKKGGGSYVEHYDKGFDATRMIDGRHCTLRVGFGNREAAGLMRRRVTIWLGNRAVVEFAGSNNHDKDGLLAGIIRLPGGRQLSPYQKVPDEYKGFRVERYNSIVEGPRASTNMAVVVHKDDIKSMLEHAVLRAIWKHLI